MKARLFVVNSDTMENTLINKEVGVIVPEPNKKMWNKTIIDILSDLLQVEIGDYIFLWESGAEKIYGVYRAVSKPFFRKEDGSNDFFKVKIDVAYDFKEPINEYDVINNPYMKNKLWNIIGKKVAGKSRGTTPITQEECQFLIQSLIDVNGTYKYIKDYKIYNVEKEISFDLKGTYDGRIPSTLEQYIYKPVKVVKGKEVQYEKALEGILNCIFRDKRTNMAKSLEIDIKNVIWFANYLPYGLERSEIDYMVMESWDGTNINKIDVIELMSSVIDMDHIDRCLQYSKWVGSSLTNGKNIVRPILICGEKSRKAEKGFKSQDIRDAILERPKAYGFKEIDIYTYCIENGHIKFEKYEMEECLYE